MLFIGGALLEDVSELVPAAKAAKYAGKAAKGIKKFFSKFKKKCCFVAGTQVLSKDGYKNIEEIKLGELLWAKNVETVVIGVSTLLGETHHFQAVKSLTAFVFLVADF